MIEVLTSGNMGLSLSGGQDGLCGYSSGLSGAAFERHLGNGKKQAIKAQALDLATLASEHANVDPIGVYHLQIKRASYHDKLTGEAKEENTLISPDFNDEPIQVWTDAGENGFGNAKEWERIDKRARNLANMENDAVMFWISPSEKGMKDDDKPPHRAYVWKKEGDNITAYSYQLFGEKESLSRFLEKMGNENDESMNLEDKTVISTDLQSFNHGRIFAVYKDSLDIHERERHKNFLGRFKNEAENSDRQLRVKIEEYQAGFETVLRQTYTNDIAAAFASALHGLFAHSLLPQVETLSREDDKKREKRNDNPIESKMTDSPLVYMTLAERSKKEEPAEDYDRNENETAVSPFSINTVDRVSNIISGIWQQFTGVDKQTSLKINSSLTPDRFFSDLMADRFVNRNRELKKEELKKQEKPQEGDKISIAAENIPAFLDDDRLHMTENLVNALVQSEEETSMDWLQELFPDKDALGALMSVQRGAKIFLRGMFSQEEDKFQTPSVLRLTEKDNTSREDEVLFMDTVDEMIDNVSRRFVNTFSLQRGKETEVENESMVWLAVLISLVQSPNIGAKEKLFLLTLIIAEEEKLDNSPLSLSEEKKQSKKKRNEPLPEMRENPRQFSTVLRGLLQDSEKGVFLRQFIRSTGKEFADILTSAMRPFLDNWKNRNMPQIKDRVFRACLESPFSTAIAQFWLQTVQPSSPYHPGYVSSCFTIFAQTWTISLRKRLSKQALKIEDKENYSTMVIGKDTDQKKASIIFTQDGVLNTFINLVDIIMEYRANESSKQVSTQGRSTEFFVFAKILKHVLFEFKNNQFAKINLYEKRTVSARMFFLLTFLLGYLVSVLTCRENAGNNRESEKVIYKKKKKRSFHSVEFLPSMGFISRKGQNQVVKIKAVKMIFPRFGLIYKYPYTCDSSFSMTK